MDEGLVLADEDVCLIASHRTVSSADRRGVAGVCGGDGLLAALDAGHIKSSAHGKNSSL